MIQLVLKWSYKCIYIFLKVLELFKCRRSDIYVTTNRNFVRLPHYNRHMMYMTLFVCDEKYKLGKFWGFSPQAFALLRGYGRGMYIGVYMLRSTSLNPSFLRGFRPSLPPPHFFRTQMLQKAKNSPPSPPQIFLTQKLQKAKNNYPTPQFFSTQRL